MHWLYLATCLCSLLILTEEEAGLPGRGWVGGCAHLGPCGWDGVEAKGPEMGCPPFYVHGRKAYGCYSFLWLLSSGRGRERA